MIRAAPNLFPRVALWSPSLEKVFGATCLIFVLELRHALDQRAKLLIAQVGYQRPNSYLEIAAQCVQPTIHLSCFR